MDREEYILIRDVLEKQGGELLIKLIHDYITDCAVTGINSDELKGMAKLAHKIKSIPAHVQKMK